MNRLVIVGNGFDMAMGPDTSVQSFILNLLKRKSLEVILYRTKGDGFIELKEVNAFFEEELSEYVGTFLDVKDINESFIQKHFTITSILLGEIIAVGNESRWYDIEKVYFDMLMSIVKSNKTKKTMISEVEKLNEELSRLIVELKIYLSDVQKTFTGSFTNKKVRDVNEQFYSGVFSNGSHEEHRIVFLNFNYTSILTKTVMDNFEKKINREVIHMHGNLVDTSDVEPLLMGYGDDLSSDFELLKASGIYEAMLHIKPNHFSKNSKYSDLLAFCEEGDFEVFVVGHSMGMTDHHILASIFERPNCKNISLFHRGTRQDFMKRVVALANHFGDRKLVQSKIRTYNQEQVLPN